MQKINIEILNIISVRFKTYNGIVYNGKIVYRRPYSSYNNTIKDDFDKSLIVWLEKLHFEVVKDQSVIIFSDESLAEYQKIYKKGTLPTKLSLRCQGMCKGEPILDENGKFKSLEFNLPIYWTALLTDFLKVKPFIPNEGDAPFEDKDKEKYFFDTIKNTKRLP